MRSASCSLLTVDELLQLRNSLFLLCKMCNSNSSQKVALCSLLGTLSALWTPPKGLGLVVGLGWRSDSVVSPGFRFTSYFVSHLLTIWGRSVVYDALLSAGCFERPLCVLSTTVCNDCHCINSTSLAELVFTSSGTKGFFLTYL